jgi:DNA-binding CsgD family transcriptional regulator
MIDTEMIEKRLNIELTTTDSEFLSKLQRKHPNLNQRELRICLLIKLNYNTRDIARSVGISTRGMESIRYRMHKKIGLTKHQSLKGYLTDLATLIH